MPGEARFVAGPRPAGRKIEVDPLFLIAHRDLATLRDVPRGLQPCSKQRFDLAHQITPAAPVPVNGVAKVPQDLGGASFPDAHVDGALVQTGLRGSQAGH